MENDIYSLEYDVLHNFVFGMQEWSWWFSSTEKHFLPVSCHFCYKSNLADLVLYVWDHMGVLNVAVLVWFAFITCLHA